MVCIATKFQHVEKMVHVIRDTQSLCSKDNHWCVIKDDIVMILRIKLYLSERRHPSSVGIIPNTVMLCCQYTENKRANQRKCVDLSGEVVSQHD